MSAIYFMSGAMVATGALKASAAESSWGLLFLAAVIATVIAACVEEHTR